MAMDLSPQFPDVTAFEGEGGGYYTWSASHFPLLSEAKIGAGKLVLKPRGFALPHYADCYKLSYVVRGCCRVGMVLPNSSKEAVLATKKGDVIPVPLGSVSWWYNDGEDSDVEIVFLGETAQTYTPAQFDYFFLTGALGILGGFSTEFISRAYDLTENESDRLTKSQTGVLIVKLVEGQNLPEPSKDANIKMLYNFESAKPIIHVNPGGSLTIATPENFPSLKKGGSLSANLVKLDPNSMLAPMYTTDSSFQLFYVTKGSGRIQIVGLNGKNALEAKVQSGQLFVVPKFFPAAKIADGEGLEYFSVVTSLEPSFVQLSGETSIWKAMSPLVLQASFNVDSGFVELFNSKIAKGTIFVASRK